jgi:hypothetical protein
MTEPRVRAVDAAKMLGLTVRGVQAMAAQGRLPGAAKIGSLWTFDPGKLRRFVAAKEDECRLSQIYTDEEASGGCEPPLPAKNIEKAYRLMMSRLRGGSGTRESKKSRRRASTASSAKHGSKRS